MKLASKALYPALMGLAVLSTSAGAQTVTPRNAGSPTATNTLAIPPSKVMESQGRSAIALTMTPDALHIVAADENGTMRLVRVADGTIVRTFTGHKGKINDVDISVDGKLLVSAGEDGTVRLFNVADGKQTATYQEHSGPVQTVAVNGTGDRIVSGGGRIILVHTPGPNVTPQRITSNSNVTSVAITSDGRTAIAGTEADGVMVFDPTSGKVTTNYKRLSGPVTSLALSENGNTAITAGQGGSVHTFVPSTGKQVSAFNAGIGTPVKAVDINAQGTLALAIGPQGAKTFVPATGKAKDNLDQQDTTGLSAVIARDGTSAAVGTVRTTTGGSVRYYTL